MRIVYHSTAPRWLADAAAGSVDQRNEMILHLLTRLPLDARRSFPACTSCAVIPCRSCVACLLTLAGPFLPARLISCTSCAVISFRLCVACVCESLAGRVWPAPAGRVWPAPALSTIRTCCVDLLLLCGPPPHVWTSSSCVDLLLLVCGLHLLFRPSAPAVWTSSSSHHQRVLLSLLLLCTIGRLSPPPPLSLLSLPPSLSFTRSLALALAPCISIYLLVSCSFDIYRSIGFFWPPPTCPPT